MVNLSSKQVFGEHYFLKYVREILEDSCFLVFGAS